MRYIMKQPSESAVQNALDNGILSNPYIAYVEDGQYIDWNSKGIDYANMYFTIEALANGNLTVNLSCSYSKNGGNWTSISPETTISVAEGDEIRFKGNLDESANGMFSGNTLSSNLYGNVLSLKYGDDFKGKNSTYELQQTFRDYSGLKDAGNLVLPTLLKNGCYQSMFWNCTSLTTAPELPATTLAQSCYLGMFSGCTSLTQVELLAINGVASCYNWMFAGCTSLHYIKCLLTNPDASLLGNVRNWVKFVSTTGTFVKHPVATWESGVSGIPDGWTVVDAED